MPNDHVVGLTTTESEEEANKIAHELIDARLAACVQVTSPIGAIYRWQGQVYDVPEWQLWIKTTADRIDAITAWLPDHHSGDEPELIFLPIIAGSDGYLTWITEETRTPVITEETRPPVANKTPVMDDEPVITGVKSPARPVMQQQPYQWHPLDY
jgi:periplasmic divalent cation tolerance protein